MPLPEDRRCWRHHGWLEPYLAGFWQRSYPEVEKELKSRYPKHFWPDDPLAAEAVRGVKRKKPAARVENP